MDALPEELQRLIVEKLCLMPGFPRALAAFSATARGPRAVGTTPDVGRPALFWDDGHRLAQAAELRVRAHS